MKSGNIKANIRKRNRVRRVERLQLVLQGLDAGKSQRKIAKELGCDEGTIRRDIKKLQLPAPYLKAVESGDSAEKYLRAIRAGAAAADRNERIAEEFETGCHSDALTEVLLEWSMGKELATADEVMIFDMAERRNWEIGDKLNAPRRNPRAVFALCEGGELPKSMPERIEFYVRALVSALVLIAPERVIRNRAINKALKEAQKSARRPRAPRSWHREYTVERRHV